MVSIRASSIVEGSFFIVSFEFGRIFSGKDISSLNSLVNSCCLGRNMEDLMVGISGMLSSESEESLKGTTTLSRASRVVALLDGL